MSSTVERLRVSAPRSTQSESRALLVVVEAFATTDIRRVVTVVGVVMPLGIVLKPIAPNALVVGTRPR